MLGLRRAHQSPHRRPSQIGDVVPSQSHRTAGQYHQPARLIPGQPGLQHLQHRMSGRIHRPHHTRIRIRRTQLPHHHIPTSAGSGGVGPCGGVVKVVPGQDRQLLTGAGVYRYRRPHHFQQPLTGLPGGSR